MKRFVVAGAACAALLSACASAPPMKLSTDKAQALSGKTLVTVVQKPPEMGVMEPGYAAFALVGALAASAAGSTFVDQFGIVDPAAQIETRLTSTLAQRHGLAKADALDMKNAKDGAPYPKREDALYVDARTTLWRYSYFSLDWGHYQVFYNALIQLVDGGTGEVLGKYECRKVSPETSEGAPTKEQMLANKSELFNSLLSKMADACATEFEAQVLPAG